MLDGHIVLTIILNTNTVEVLLVLSEKEPNKKIKPLIEELNKV